MKETGPLPRRQRVRVRIATRSFPRERMRIGAKVWVGVLAASVLLGAAAGWQIGRSIRSAWEIRKVRPAAESPRPRPTASIHSKTTAPAPAAPSPAASAGAGA